MDIQKTAKFARLIIVIGLVGVSPLGVLLYFVLAYESVAAMVILGVITALTLILLGAAITLVGQHVHAKLNASNMALNMQENSALIRAYSSAMNAAVNVKKANESITKQVPAETSPTLVIDQDAYSELDLPLQEVQ